MKPAKGYANFQKGKLEISIATIVMSLKRGNLDTLGKGFQRTKHWEIRRRWWTEKRRGSLWGPPAPVTGPPKW